MAKAKKAEAAGADGKFIVIHRFFVPVLCFRVLILSCILPVMQKFTMWQVLVEKICVMLLIPFVILYTGLLSL